MMAVAISQVQAADVLVDNIVISSFPVYKKATSAETTSSVDAGFKEQSGITTFTKAKLLAETEVGCGACIRSGLEYILSAASKWNTEIASKQSSVTKGLCCIPGVTDATNSCDPTGVTAPFNNAPASRKVAYTDLKTGFSSLELGIPEIAFLQCPQGEDLCGTNRIISVAATGTLTMGNGVLNIKRAIDQCSWLLKSECKPITLEYSANDSTLITETDVKKIWKVQYLEVPTASVTDGLVAAATTFASADDMNTYSGDSKFWDVTQHYSSSQALKGWTRKIPLDAIMLWVKSFNQKVVIHDQKVATYDIEVKDFDIIHAPVEAEKKYKETWEADLEAAIDKFTKYM